MTRTARLVLCLLFWATAAVAQDAPPAPALLVADDVRLTADDKLIATGNVEAMYQGRRLTASAITYDRRTDQISITGPLTLTDTTENTVVLADSADLDRDLTNGLLRGARIVMADQLQLAANEMNRVNGRYNQLYMAAVTSCHVCETGRPPLWQIRAERMIHDQQGRQLYFQNAQFRILDVPVLYLPRLRLPDPTLDRATGFLTPSLVSSSLLGTGVRVPYFIRLGDHRDLTLAPFWATDSRRLELRYRQAFRTGDIEFNAAISDDDFNPRSSRGYLFAEGRFDLPRDFKLGFNLELASDDTFLLDHGFSEKDRLQSGLSLERARRDEYIRGALTHVQSLRDGESNATLPSIIGNGEYERRFFPRRLGGELRFAAVAHSHYRSSDLTTDGPDPDRFADGRDVTRLTTSLDWHKTWTLPAGILGRLQTGLALDHFEIGQAGLTSLSQATELTPTAALELRWPWIKSTPRNVTHVIEPVVQLAWIGGSNPDIPNDESILIEFDEGNLFNPSRFTAPDRRERGYQAAYGLSWTRLDPSGWQGSLALGQVVRDEQLTEPGGATPSFTKSSGLRDRRSDLLIAGQFRNGTGLTVTARSLFDDVFDTTKAEARASWQNDRTDIGATYVWLSDDPAENRFSTVSEWSIDGSYRFARHWTGSAEWRYDAASDRSVRAGAGLTYTNECVDVTLSISRRFTTSTILEPETNIGFTIGVRGFSAGTRDTSFTRKCKN
ncbi:LPS-assembly protein [Roseovarius azorensis]|uniref:LPS-assembly protein LptD n=1 Tax=Roseovarius azorensis TaxID=1287727 RepID=A0A1H7GXY4_9RHOB|nr:LPS assembly protein LptD [Roseovarius azorensis]SEK41510.1 LPS-assembly protein [Roseovarius azorensis]